MTSVPLTHDQSLPADWRDLLALTKPRVMSLVVFTGLCGLLAAPVPVHPVLGFTAVLCIALGAGAAGALNQWYEADLDAKMKRTANRPLPAGRMTRQTALHFGVGLAVFSVILMDLAANHLAAAILARFDPVLCAGLYRLAEAADRAEHRHRRRGRGLSAADRLGGRYRRRSTLPMLLFAIIFLWTPPHFWALSLFVRTDYANAGVPMLPVVAGIESTRRHILLYTLPMIAAAIAPWALGLTGWVYGAASIVAQCDLPGAGLCGVRQQGDRTQGDGT